MAGLNPLPGRRERRRARTTHAILDAAERHFLERGYDDAKVDAIAADADVSIGSIYNYFGSKEGLYGALLARALERFDVYMKGERPELSPLDHVLDTSGRLARFARENPGQMRLLCFPQPAASGDELSDVLARVERAMADGERRTAASLEAAIRLGAVPPLPSRETAAFLWAAWKGMLTLGRRAEAAAPGRDRELEAAIEAGLRVVVGGLASDEARRSDETVRAILESAPSRARAVERPLELRRGAVAGELRERFPELALWVAEVDGAARPSPAAVRRRLAVAGDRLTATVAVGGRGESMPWAYKVFVRRLGLDPGECRDDVERVALGEPADGYEAAGIPRDALLVAAAETGIPVYAFDRAKLHGELWLRPAQPGEAVGGSPPLPAGRPVLADSLGAVAAPFGATSPDHAVTEAGNGIALAALQVKGIADVSVEEALWIAIEAIRQR